MTTARPVRRHSTRKVIVPIGATAVLACLAVGLPAAQADNGTDHGTSDVFGVWAQSGFTARQTDPNPPVDVDGATGEDNLANVFQLGARHEQQVPGTTTLVQTDWVSSQPAGEGWTQIADRVVTDSDAVPATSDTWTNRVWHVYAGNNNSDTAPSVDDPHWNATGGDPHSANHAFADHQPNVPYSVDKANGKGSDWFMWTATLVPGNPGHDAVTHQEFRYQREVTTPGHTEYYWAIYRRTNTPGGSTADPDDPGQPSDPSRPNEPAKPSQPAHHEAVSDAVTNPEHAVRSVRSGRSGQLVKPSADHSAVPLSIDAGL